MTTISGSMVATPAFTIRAASQDDLSSVRELLDRAALPTDGLEDQFGDQYILAVSDSGEVIGTAGLEVYGNYGLLRSAVVAEEWRGRGIGAALTSDRVQEAHRRRLHSIWALTTTAESYFPRLGFTVSERAAVPAAVLRSPEFSGVCPSTAVVLTMDVKGGDAIRTVVRDKYAAAARSAASGKSASCCGSSGETACCGSDKAKPWNPITSDLYEEGEKQGLPAEALLASLGCGNPTALAELHEGETVLDLGSGGGIDVLLSAKRVGPQGRVYGLDMTDEMLALAEENRRRAGVSNVEFLKGEIENVPLPDASVDVIISNCVINLSADKGQVLREAFRVLRPGGRFAVSDIVVRGEMPDALRRDAELWAGCVAGALEENEYRRLLAEAGFERIDVEPTRVYGKEDAQALLSGSDVNSSAAETLDRKFMSAFVRARKPEQRSAPRV